jgi:hypothetical protein
VVEEHAKGEGRISEESCVHGECVRVHLGKNGRDVREVGRLTICMRPLFSASEAKFGCVSCGAIWVMCFWSEK